MRSILALLVAAAAASGCVADEGRPAPFEPIPSDAGDAATGDPKAREPSPSPPESGPPAQPPPPLADPADAALTAPTSLALTKCWEGSGRFPAPAPDFDGLPPGFTLVLDGSGSATILAVGRSCTLGEEPVRALLAGVLVLPLEELRAAGADHVVLLDAWIDSPALLSALQSWGLSSGEARGLKHEWTMAGAAAEARIMVEPDFLLAIQAAGAVEAGMRGTVRTFEVADGNVTAAFDSVRPGIEILSGPATASFIVEPTGSDLPDHRPGTGAYMVSSEFDVTYRVSES